MTNPLIKTPSWGAAMASKDAWNKIRKTAASDKDKAKAKSDYKRSMLQCLSEAGLRAKR